MLPDAVSVRRPEGIAHLLPWRQQVAFRFWRLNDVPCTCNCWAPVQEVHARQLTMGAQRTHSIPAANA